MHDFRTVAHWVWARLLQSFGLEVSPICSCFMSCFVSFVSALFRTNCVIKSSCMKIFTSGFNTPLDAKCVAAKELQSSVECIQVLSEFLYALIFRPLVLHWCYFRDWHICCFLLDCTANANFSCKTVLAAVAGKSKWTGSGSLAGKMWSYICFGICCCPVFIRSCELFITAEINSCELFITDANPSWDQVIIDIIIDTG